MTVWTEEQLAAMSQLALEAAAAEKGEQVRNLRFALRRAPTTEALAAHEAELAQLEGALADRAGGGPEPEL